MQNADTTLLKSLLFGFGKDFSGDRWEKLVVYVKDDLRSSWFISIIRDSCSNPRPFLGT